MESISTHHPPTMWGRGYQLTIIDRRASIPDARFCSAVASEIACLSVLSNGAAWLHVPHRARAEMAKINCIVAAIVRLYREYRWWRLTVLFVTDYEALEPNWLVTLEVLPIYICICVARETIIVQNRSLWHQFWLPYTENSLPFDELSNYLWMYRMSAACSSTMNGVTVAWMEIKRKVLAWTELLQLSSEGSWNSLYTVFL